MSTTEPGTSPPPSTRSSSLTPVGRRANPCGATSPSDCAAAVPVWIRPVRDGADTVVSCNTLQALHAGHWPTHLGVCAPHSLQT